MAFLITTTHHVLAFDGKDRFFRAHSGKGLYYGLARHGSCIFVSCRNRTDGPDLPSARENETGSILVLDATSLRPIGEVRPDFPLRDLHGIGYFDGKLWATCSFDNMIAIYDTKTLSWTKWYPSVDDSARGRDVNHFNTILPLDDRLALLAHNNGQSQLLTYDRRSLQLCTALDLGRHAHDVFRVAGGVGTCSSSDGLLIGTTGWALRTGAFPRGVAFDNERIAVGLSQTAPRAHRHEKSGIVRCFTTDWVQVADYVLPSVGMILAILAIDLDLNEVADLEPFPAQCCCGEYNSLEPGNVYTAASAAAVFAPEWHASEGTHCWTAAHESRKNIVINPGERTLFLSWSSGFPGPYWGEILLNRKSLGVTQWPGPGHMRSQLSLPHGVRGSSQLTFKVPHLWRPSDCLGTEDQRMLGVGVETVTIV